MFAKRIDISKGSLVLRGAGPGKTILLFPNSLTDLNMDHHREANYASLFSNLDCGAGTRPFNSGGSGNRGAHSGAYSTYWNIHARAAMLLPPTDFGPLLNFIGVQLVETNQDPVSPYQWLI